VIFVMSAMVWLPEKMVSGVLRFGLEASERWMNVGSIRTVAVAAVFSDVLLSSAARSATGRRISHRSPIR
ncbi:MAG TPA: hypothetical protein VK777_27860, partial [Reyranella sp.]|nr:hypothetical protein [Reyranella sp.]